MGLVKQAADPLSTNHLVVRKNVQIEASHGVLRRAFRGEWQVPTHLGPGEYVRLPGRRHTIDSDEGQVRTTIEKDRNQLRVPPGAVEVKRQGIDLAKGVGKLLHIVGETAKHEIFAVAITARHELAIAVRTVATDGFFIVRPLAFPLLVIKLVVQLCHDDGAVDVTLPQMLGQAND